MQCSEVEFLVAPLHMLYSHTLLTARSSCMSHQAIESQSQSEPYHLYIARTHPSAGQRLPPSLTMIAPRAITIDVSTSDIISMNVTEQLYSRNRHRRTAT